MKTAKNSDEKYPTYDILDMGKRLLWKDENGNYQPDKWAERK